MEFLVAAPLFHRRHRRVLHGATLPCRPHGHHILPHRHPGIYRYPSQNACLGCPVGGWPSLACLITLFGGMQLLCLGIIGEYLAKAYLETKRRPIYIVRESNEDSDDTVQ